MNRRDFLKTLGAGVVSFAVPGCIDTAKFSVADPAVNKPNFVVIFCDDMGYGDLACYGHPTIRTPNIDRMAREGQKWTNFYSAASICTPSRAALLTGRLPIRSGMCSSKHGVLFPDSAGGLPQTEITIARALKTQGYATACIGKWHLGHLPQYLPTSHGFDYYFGIPYSNDMRPENPHIWAKKQDYPPLPLMENEQIIEQSPDQGQLTRRYTEKAIEFINENQNKQFFLYLPHTFPHTPLYSAPPFKDKSRRGLYGDVVEELDWSVGQILDTLVRGGLAENTLVMFTSDNGPWLIRKLNGGSAGSLRGGKASTWEGGMREPFVTWWPGKIKAGQTIQQMASTLDILPTILTLAGTKIPDDRIIDGVDISSVLYSTGKSPRNIMFYYRGAELYAVRKGPYKVHFSTKPSDGLSWKTTKHNPPLLYHLDHDPSEKFDIGKENPDIIADIINEAKKHKATLIPVEDQLVKKLK